MDLNVGLLGELAVEMQLVRHGWHTIRLNGSRSAPNADLLAIQLRKRINIQVKTTAADGQHSHSNCLGFGYSGPYLKDGKSIFNSKSSPLIADVVVGVAYVDNNTRYFIIPVAVAERLCKAHCDYWSKVPKLAGTYRSPSFPIYIHYQKPSSSHTEHHLKMMKNLIEYENMWELLHEPLGRLHDSAQWPWQE